MLAKELGIGPNGPTKSSKNGHRKIAPKDNKTIRGRPRDQKKLASQDSSTSAGSGSDNVGTGPNKRRGSVTMKVLTTNLQDHIKDMGIGEELKKGQRVKKEQTDDARTLAKLKDEREKELISRFTAANFIEEVENEMGKKEKSMKVSYATAHEYFTKRNELRGACLSLPFTIIFWALFMRICWHHGHITESYYLRSTIDTMFNSISVIEAADDRRRLQEYKDPDDHDSKRILREDESPYFDNDDNHTDWAWKWGGEELDEDEIALLSKNITIPPPEPTFLSPTVESWLHQKKKEEYDNSGQDAQKEEAAKRDKWFEEYKQLNQELDPDEDEEERRMLHNNLDMGVFTSHGSIGWAHLGPVKVTSGSIFKVASTKDALEWLQWGLMTQIWFGSENSPKFVRSHNKIVGAARIYQKRREAIECPDMSLRDFYNRHCHSETTSRKRLGIPDRGMVYVPDSKDRYKFFVEPRRGYNGMLYLFEELSVNNWLDAGTSELTFEMLLYNSEARMFGRSYVRFIFDFTGLVSVFKNTDTIPSKHYETTAQMLLDAIWVLMLFWCCFKEVRRLRAARKQQKLIQHVTQFWNALEILLVIFGFSCAIYLTTLAAPIEVLSGRIAALPETFVPTWQHGDNKIPGYLREVDSILDRVQAMVDNKLELKGLVFFYTILLLLRFFRAFEGQPRLAIIEKTLTSAWVDTIHFLIIFFVVFCNFALGGYLLFGFEVPDWYTADRAINSSFRALMGDFDYGSMYRVSPICSALWFWLYMILMFLILLNMFLAIIMDTYMDVKKHTDKCAVTIWEQAYDYFKDWQLENEAKHNGRPHLWKEMVREFKPPMAQRIDGVINTIFIDINERHHGKKFEEVDEDGLNQYEKREIWEKKYVDKDLLMNKFRISERSAINLMRVFQSDEESRLALLLDPKRQLEDKLQAACVFLKNQLQSLMKLLEKETKEIKRDCTTDSFTLRRDLRTGFKVMHQMNQNVNKIKDHVFNLSFGITKDTKSDSDEDSPFQFTDKASTVPEKKEKKLPKHRQWNPNWAEVRETSPRGKSRSPEPTRRSNSKSPPRTRRSGGHVSS